MPKKLPHFWLLCFFVLIANSQEVKRSFLFPKKIGILYSNTNEKSFLFDDTDYSYKSNTIKLQAFYSLGNTNSFDFELIVQPHIQVLKHQLLNEQFVLPTEENYQEKRTEFTKLKIMHLYAFELGFSIKKEVFKKLSLEVKIGLGIATIDTKTERLAKGFTFIDNFYLGLLYKTSSKTFLYLGSTAGHVSNFNTQNPNSGYNSLGYEIGFQYQLN